MKKTIIALMALTFCAAPAGAEVSKAEPGKTTVTAQAVMDPAVQRVLVPQTAPLTVTAAPGADSLTGKILQPATVTAVTADVAASTIPAVIDLSPDMINFDASAKDGIKLSWTPKQKDNVYYNVYRSAQTVEFTKINEVEFSKPEYVDLKITSATSYYYKVEALDNSRNSYMSKTQTARSADIINPMPPVNFKSYQDVQSVSLRWAQPGQGSFLLSGYNLYRGSKTEENNFLKFIPSAKTYFSDEEVEPGLRYYYKMASVDIKGNESKLTDTVSAVPFPKPRTSVCLMPTAYRNNIFDNMGLNVDMGFTYYIGTVFGEHNTSVLQKDADTFSKNGVWLLSIDAKWTFFNEDEDWYPSIGLGLMYSLLLQDSVGASSSFSQNVGTTLSTKAPVLGQQGVFITATKKLPWDVTFTGGYVQGFKLYKGDKGKGTSGYLTYIVSSILGGNNAGETGSETSNTSAEVRNSYFIGISRDIFKKVGIKVEITVPLEFNKNPLLPNTYIINTHIDRLFNFDIAYIHYDGGYAWLGYYNLRFSVYPSPYK